MNILRDLYGNMVAGAQLAGLLPVERSRFRPGLDQTVLLLILVSLAGVFLTFNTTKPDRVFNDVGLSTVAVAAIALLFACYVAARLRNRADEFATLFAATASALSVLYLVAGAILHVLWAAGPTLMQTSPNTMSFFIAACSLVVLYRAVHMVLGDTHLISAAVAASMLVPIVAHEFVPREPLWISIAEEVDPTEKTAAEFDPDVEAIYYRQTALLKAATDGLARQREDTIDLYFVGFAGHAHEDVFMKEVRAVQTLFDERFDTRDRSLLLVNNPATVETTPLANRHNLAAALKAIGERMDRGQDILFLFLTSQGSQDLLSAKFYPFGQNDLTADDLRQVLDDSGIKWRVVVVSACYSGSFIDELRSSDTLVVTASSADRNSFDCNYRNGWTYFGKAYFDEALPLSNSFIEAFDAALTLVSTREDARDLKASMPQIDVGTKIEDVLEQFQSRLGTRTEGQIATQPAPPGDTPIDPIPAPQPVFPDRSAPAAQTSPPDESTPAAQY